MREIVYRPRAACDIESIVVYLGQVLERPDAAHAWYESLGQAVDLLREMPDLGRPFDDARLVIKGRRAFLVGDHRIFYSLDDKELTVWRVLHVRQDIDDFAIIDMSD